MATKKTDTKAVTATEETKEVAEVAKKAPAKKTATKKAATKKATTEKAEAAAPAVTEEKAPAKKPAAKKAPAKKAPAKKAVAAKVEFFVEYGGTQVSIDEVIQNVKVVNGKPAKNITVYLKPEESKAYFVADGEEKEMDVFFC